MFSLCTRPETYGEHRARKDAEALWGKYRRRKTVQGREIKPTPQEELDDSVSGIRKGIRERYNKESEVAFRTRIKAEHKVSLGDMLEIERDYVSAVWFLRDLEQDERQRQREKDQRRYRPIRSFSYDPDMLELRELHDMVLRHMGMAS